MSEDNAADADLIRSRVSEATQSLVGMKAWGTGQTLGMLQLGFGELHSIRQEYGPNRGQQRDVASLALHAQSDWEVLDHGASAIRFGPECFDSDGESSVESRQMIRSTIGSGERVVQAIEVQHRAGLMLHLTGAVTIRVAEPSDLGEKWRLFRTGESGEHFVVEVVSGGLDSGRLQVSES